MPIISLKSGTKSRSLLVGNAFFNPSSFESIATATGTGSSGTITFSSIPATYSRLQIRYIARSSAAFDNDYVAFRFNSDSATNYSWHIIEGNGATASAGGGTNNDIAYSGEIPAASAGSSIIGIGIIDIPDYASTNKAKTVTSYAGNDRNNSGAFRITSDLWRSTSAINQIDITTFRGANWTTSTTFALYGIKGV